MPLLVSLNGMAEVVARAPMTRAKTVVRRMIFKKAWRCLGNVAQFGRKICRMSRIVARTGMGSVAYLNAVCLYC